MVDQKTNAETRLAEFFSMLMDFQNTSSKSAEDSILLAGAMMSVARILYFDNLSVIQFKMLLKQTHHKYTRLFHSVCLIIWL